MKQVFKSLSRWQVGVIQGVLLLFAVLWILPLTNVVQISFRGEGFGNYRTLFGIGLPMTRMIFNSIFVAVLQVLLIVGVSSLASFTFSKMNFVGRSLLFSLVILTLTIPMISLITPLFAIVRRFNLANTYFALVLPAATLWMPVAVLIQKNYYDSLPNELMEAAKIDGCSLFSIFTHIYFPLGKPATINVVVFAFMHAWNDFLNPLLFSRSVNMYTLPLAVNAVTTTIRGSRPEVVMACLVIMAIPSILLYIALQKYLGEGMAAGGIKG